MSVGRVHSLIVALTWFIYNSMYESAERYEGGLPSQVTVLRSSITMACMSSVLLTDDGNEGDNQPTIRCQLAAGLYGKHRRSFTNGRNCSAQAVGEVGPELTIPKPAGSGCARYTPVFRRCTLSVRSSGCGQVAFREGPHICVRSPCDLARGCV